MSLRAGASSAEPRVRSGDHAPGETVCFFSVSSRRFCLWLHLGHSFWFKPNFSFSGTCCISAEYSHRSHPPRGPHTASFFPESSKFLVPASAAACVYTRVTFTSSDMVWISPPALRGGCLSAPPVTHHAQAAEATKRNRMTLRC